MADTALFTAEALGLPGVLKITPRVFNDERGLSSTTYAPEQFAAIGITEQFVQDYFSHSHKHVIRGMHFQRAPYAQGKLVRCASGEIFDVAADCDPASPTYGTYVSTTLSADAQTMLYIPGRYAHGFCVLSDQAVVEYKMSSIYEPNYAGGVRFDDPRLGIEWPISSPILSPRDASWPLLPHT
ncbi:MAG TPA: dTDP-4-dehydrorhamnose 3,5-epimerase [Candidatus Paceibacterota bacterium]|nr:dTDP-4-dehydrorhamnose 3,5-epimerase [Candidatus Paceibacterota bacterium]